MAQLHEIKLKTGKTVYGFISWVDYNNDTFYFLEPNQIGMLGKDGAPIKWADCYSICADPGQRGIYDGPDRIEAWKEFRAAKSGAG